MRILMTIRNWRHFVATINSIKGMRLRIGGHDWVSISRAIRRGESLYLDSGWDYMMQLAESDFT